MANMDWLQRNYNNSLADPALGFTVVNHFAGNEGWTAIPSFKNHNADYVAKDYSNSTRTPGTFQARAYNNSTRTPAAYKRHNYTNVGVDA